jgi:hypothetical protein
MTLHAVVGVSGNTGGAATDAAYVLNPPAYTLPDLFARAEALGRPVSVAVVPEAEWPAALERWRFSPRTIASWVELFQAFNAGRIDFQRGGSVPLAGRVSLRDAIGAIVRGTPGS